MTDLDKAKAMKLKIHSRDRCENCGHWSGDAEQPFRIYSEARAKWLEKAVEIAKEVEGDDDWVDWRDEGKRLSAMKE